MNKGEYPPIANFSKRKGILPFSPQTLALLGSDCCALFLALLGGFVLRLCFGAFLPLSLYISLLPFIFLLPVFFGLIQLYPGTFLPPAEELKRLFLATSTGFLLLSMFFFLTKQGDAFSRFFFLAAWLFAIILIPTLRYILRIKCCQKKWWLTPVIIIGTHADMKNTHFSAGRSRFTGFCNVAHLLPQYAADTTCSASSSQSDISPYILSLPETSSELIFEEQIAPFKEKYPTATVLIHVGSLPSTHLNDCIEAVGMAFHNVILLPRMGWLQTNPSQIVHLQHTFGLSLRRNLVDKRRRTLKRVIDLALTCLVCIPAIPLGIVLAFLVKISSKGPVLYSQKRIGQDGQPFTVYKFRTMMLDADTFLKSYLQNNPAAMQEWQATQKLKEDPRITRIGKFLRATSLDELPQIINVFKGDMSLVGPRPIVANEVEKYAKSFAIYARVLPGITGLWQVSGRNDTTYEERIQLDTYYIANWSIWLDIYIILRTIPEVLLRKGAY